MPRLLINLRCLFCSSVFLDCIKAFGTHLFERFALKNFWKITRGLAPYNPHLRRHLGCSADVWCVVHDTNAAAGTSHGVELARCF